MHIAGLLITCFGARKQKITCVHAPQLVFFQNVINGQRASPLSPLLFCPKAPTLELQRVGSSRAACPPFSRGLQPKPQWAVAPSEPTLWGGALASGAAEGQVRCALPPCQKGHPLNSQGAPLAGPTAGCSALVAPATYLVANCKAKMKMGCSL